MTCVESRGGWGSAPDCCARDPEGCAPWRGRRVLLVGEAINVGRRRVPPAVHTHWLRSDDLTRRFGAFRLGTGRARLIRCGIRWSESADLLPPGPCGWWDEELARTAAAAWMPLWTARYDLVVLVGKRVAGAARIAASTDRVLLIAHPSGRNRQWNDPAHLGRVREEVRQAAERAQLQGRS